MVEPYSYCSMSAKTKETALQRMTDAAPALRKLSDIADETAVMAADLAVGNVYIDKEGDLVRITGLEQTYQTEKNKHFFESDYYRKYTDETGKPFIVTVKMETRRYSDYVYEAGEGHDIEWKRYYDDKDSNQFLKEFGEARLTKSVEEYDAEILALMETGDFSAFSVLTKSGKPKAGMGPDDDEEETGTGMVHAGSKEHMVALAESMQKQRNHVVVIERTLRREMERRKNQVEQVRRKLEVAMTIFKKQLKRIYRFIQTIELYLGINEEIIQIQEGETAPVETPISFRQQVLYMDEEVGALGEDGKGLDYTQIDTFDTWLLTNRNFLRVLPEIKGVVVFRVRRNPKKYGNSSNDFGTAMRNAAKNEENMRTYILIRNGENIYRIWADLVIEPRLFPRRAELQALFEKVEAEQNNSRYSKEEAEDALAETMQTYKARVIMMQGLLERTAILHPLPRAINLFHLDDEAQNMVQFIYDDEAALTDGRITFWAWVEQINKDIQRGSRVINSAAYGGGYSSRSVREDYEKRFRRWYQYKESIPPLPTKGLYTVESIEGETYDIGLGKRSTGGIMGEPKKEWYVEEPIDHGYFKEDENGKKIILRTEDKLYIKYIPMNYHGEPMSKNRIAFEIMRDDEFIMNYDRIGLDDIEYYLNSRIDRPNYLEMLPLLRTLKKMRLAELEWEKSFVKLVMGEIIKNKSITVPGGTDLEAVVWEAIDWWKHKNIWKRPITKDDALALRMIKARIERRFRE